MFRKSRNRFFDKDMQTKILGLGGQERGTANERYQCLIVSHYCQTSHCVSMDIFEIVQPIFGRVACSYLLVSGHQSTPPACRLSAITEPEQSPQNSPLLDHLVGRDAT